MEMAELPMVETSATYLPFTLYNNAKDGGHDKVKQWGLRMFKRDVPGQNLFYLEPALTTIWGDWR
jgi:hypothetical protein